MRIEEKLRDEIMKNLYYADDHPLGEEDSFLETGVIDSMGVMELVAYVQSEFGLNVKQDEIVVENFDSIRKLANFIRRRLGEKVDSVAVMDAPPLPERPSLAA